MEKITTIADLREAILRLEYRKTEEEYMLKRHFHQAYDSIKPINLLKKTIHDAAASIDLKDNMLNTSIGLGAGYLAKLLLTGATRNPITKLVGSALMFGITNVVANNPDTMKSLGSRVLKLFKRKHRDTD